MLPPGTVSPEEQQILIDYLEAGGAVYLEGTNIGEDHFGTGFWSYFGAEYLGQGSVHNEIELLLGNDSGFTSFTEFGYAAGTYADIYVNRLQTSSGNLLFTSQDQFERVISNQYNSYRTLASSVVFGAMSNGEIVSKKYNLMSLYLSFLLDREGPNTWISEDQIDFGTVTPGNGQVYELYLQNTGQDLLEIYSIQIEGEGFIYEGEDQFELEFGHFEILEIGFPAINQGNYEAELVIQTNDPEYPQLIVQLNGDCFADPVLVVYPETIEIAVSSGDIATTEFSISNNGGGYLDYSLEVKTFLSRNSGGPDQYGYYWLDSNEEYGPEFLWQDISSIGTDAGLTGVDSYILMNLPFPFRFYGELKNQVTVSSNGYLTFGSDGIDYSNDPIPYPSEPNDLIAVFWDDLSSGGNGQLFNYYDEDENCFILQYDNWEIFSSQELVNFQVKLFSSGDIQFLYQEMNGYLRSATVGIEDREATTGLEIVHNSYYLENELLVELKTRPNWLTLSSYYGSVLSGDPHTIEIVVNAENMETGDHLVEISILSEDPVNPEVIVPVIVNINETGFENSDLIVLPLLKQNYPNPFNYSQSSRANSKTTIPYSLNNNGRVELSVFDIRGREVKNLISEFQSQGDHTADWFGDNNQGKILPAGIYFYQLRHNNQIVTRKMTFIK